MDSKEKENNTILIIEIEYLKEVNNIIMIIEKKD